MTDESPWDRLWSENRARHSLDGMIGLAEGGDTYAARQLLAKFIVQARRQIGRRESLERRATDPVDPRLMLYIAAKLASVLQADPVHAGRELRLRPGRSGRARRNMEQHFERARLAVAVADSYEASGSLDQAIVCIAELWHVSQSTAKQAYQEFIVAFRDEAGQKTR